MDPAAPTAASEAEPAEHFASLEQQEHAAHLGMWLFLTSETLLFGALLGLYTAYRLVYGSDFVEAARHNDTVLGTLNTAVLVSSSFFAARAVSAVAHDRRRAAFGSLAATVTLALAFLAIKSVEYRDHFAHGIYPGAHYDYEALPRAGAKVFFTLYYLMTGLHALHVIGGLVTLLVLTWFLFRRRLSAQRHTPLELGVLYWHLVDVIWIFLWPLLYLGGGGAR